MAYDRFREAIQVKGKHEKKRAMDNEAMRSSKRLATDQVEAGTCPDPKEVIILGGVKKKVERT